MDRVKSYIFLSAAVLFLVGCGQSTPNVNLSRPAATPVTNAPANGANVAARVVNQNLSIAQRLNRGADVAPVDVDDNAVDAYTENCMICHKDTGKGGKVTIEGKSLNPVDLTSAKMKARSDEKLLAQIKVGAPDDGMPAFKDKLSDEVIMGIIKHIRTLQAAAR
jgi:mono/diheme cytochrome c family protein